MGEETTGMVNLTIGKCPIELREQGKAFHDLGLFYAHGVLYSNEQWLGYGKNDV